jgi:hypothetical protein
LRWNLAYLVFEMCGLRKIAIALIAAMFASPAAAQSDTSAVTAKLNNFFPKATVDPFQCTVGGSENVCNSKVSHQSESWFDAKVETLWQATYRSGELCTLSVTVLSPALLTRTLVVAVTVDPPENEQSNIARSVLDADVGVGRWTLFQRDTSAFWSLGARLRACG